MVQGICLRPMERYDVNEDYRINIATVDEGGESDCDAVPQLLLVSKSNLSSVQHVIHVNEDDLYLALVVDLGAQCRSIRENIFCSNSC